MTRFAVLFGLIVWLIPATYSQAELAIAKWTEASEFTADGASGFDFTPINTIRVTRLMLWDSGSDGLAVAHEVGIFHTATQQLLTSALVLAGVSSPVVGTTLNDGVFRGELIVPLVLDAGKTYSIIGDDLQPDGISSAIDSNVGLRTGLTFVRGRGENLFPGLQFPAATGTSFFGPSFEFEVIPEPTTAPLGLALAGFFLRRRCRRM